MWKMLFMVWVNCFLNCNLQKKEKRKVKATICDQLLKIKHHFMSCSKQNDYYVCVCVSLQWCFMEHLSAKWNESPARPKTCLPAEHLKLACAFTVTGTEWMNVLDFIWYKSDINESDAECSDPSRHLFSPPQCLWQQANPDSSLHVRSAVWTSTLTEAVTATHPTSEQ